MNEEKKVSENILILKRLSRNNDSKSFVIPTALPIINNNNSLSSLSLNLSSDLKIGASRSPLKDKQKSPEIIHYNKKVNLNPKIFKILNSSIIKPSKNTKKYNKNKLFGKIAHKIAIEKMNCLHFK